MRATRPLISVLIPLHNAENWITDTIRSALNKTREHKEVIVVNNGSKGDSLQIARSIDDDQLFVVRIPA